MVSWAQQRQLWLCYLSSRLLMVLGRLPTVRQLGLAPKITTNTLVIFGMASWVNRPVSAAVA